MSNHPFAPILEHIDPRCQIVSPELLAQHEGDKLAVTAIVATPIGQPMMALDIFLHPERGRARVSCPVELPTLLVFPDTSFDGLVPIYTFGADTCNCRSNVHDGNRWNPFCVALVWFEGLLPLTATIARAYQRLLVERHKEFCVHGMRILFGPDYKE